MTFPRQTELDTIVVVARLAMSHQGIGKSEALDFACASLSQMCFDATHRTKGFESEMSEERAEGWRELGAMVYDVVNEFESPTVGNVRDYALSLV